MMFNLAVVYRPSIKWACDWLSQYQFCRSYFSRWQLWRHAKKCHQSSGCSVVSASSCCRGLTSPL